MWVRAQGESSYELPGTSDHPPFPLSVTSKVVHIISDSIAMVYYLNKQGGTGSKKLCRNVIVLWQQCTKCLFI